MRWSYLIPRIVILAVIWGFFAFGFDPMLRYGAVETLQAMTGAKADVATLSTGFFPPRLNISGVALASQSKPGTNLVQFNDMTLHLAGDPLLRRSWVVEEASVTGVRFGTSRNDNGQLDIDPDDEESGGPLVPPWLTDKVTAIGDEWLEQFTAQAKAKLDPNLLETYRVGNELYTKWDDRFQDIRGQISSTQSELDLLKNQIEAARKAEPLQQVEIYLQVAQRSDILMRNSRSTIDQLRRSIPIELKQDAVRLDQAQKNDRANVVQTIQMLKPDPRQITESIIGEQLYAQLQQMLTWLETIRTYQKQMKAPPEPERYRGRDFEFELLNPTPRLLCRKMLIDGELMLDNMPTPFKAVLTDVTSDPRLHGRPALLQVSTAGEMPIQLVVRHDATGDVATTVLSADYTDGKEQSLAVGKPGRDQLLASLSDTQWNARLSLSEGNVSGKINVRSHFGRPQITTTQPMATALADLTEQTLSGITTVNAALSLEGSVKRPEVKITSDIGEQLALGFQAGFQNFVPQMQSQLTGMVDGYVQKQKQELTKKLNTQYTALLTDHGKLQTALNDARQLAMDLRSGKVDPDKVFRMASDSGMLSEKDQQKADKYMGQSKEVLEGLKNPQQTIQNALPGLRRKLFR